MKVETLKAEIDSLVRCLVFDYKGAECGVDPLSHSHFEMWCDERTMTAENIETVMNAPFFLGKSLADIAEEIEVTEG